MRDANMQAAQTAAVVSPARRSLHIMYASIDSEPELEGYPRAVRDFERAAKRHER